MGKLLKEPAPIRSFMASFVAPLTPGEVTTNTRLIRQGANVAQTSAEVVVDGNICLQAMAAYGYSEQSGSIFDEKRQLLALSRQCMVYFE